MSYCLDKTTHASIVLMCTFPYQAQHFTSCRFNVAKRCKMCVIVNNMCIPPNESHHFNQKHLECHCGAGAYCTCHTYILSILCSQGVNCISIYIGLLTNCHCLSDAQGHIRLDRSCLLVVAYVCCAKNRRFTSSTSPYSHI